MEGPNCELCISAPGTCICICKGKPLLLCTDCITQHLSSPGNHQISLYRPAQRRESNLICDECLSADAESLCICITPIQKYCEYCRVTHINKAPYFPHSLLPIKAWRYLKEEDTNFTSLVQEMNRVKAVKEFLVANLHRIDRFRKEFKEMCNRFISEIEEFASEIMKKTDEIRAKAERKIGKICEELEEHVFDLDYVSETPEIQLIRWLSADELESSLYLLKCNIVDRSCIEFLNHSVAIDEIIDDFAVAICPMTLKGRQLVKYCLPHGRKKVEELPFDTGANSGTALILVDFGTLLGVGGTSSNKVFSLHLLRTALEHLPSMSLVRAYAGIYWWKQRLLVFGGYNGSYLNSCEMLSLASKQWSNLPSMLQARYGFTQSKFRQYLVMIGDKRAEGRLRSTI